jgi:hypothetical protein
MTNSFLNTTTKNIHWFKKTHDSGELQMNPPFQRNPVWLDRQKSFLIDTILSGLPIPEIYMQETVSEEGLAKYIVVDGQQRLRAVLEFLEGRFAIDEKDSPQWADMTFEDLSGAQKKHIYQYDFVVRQLPSMDDVQLRMVFQRLNRNVVALNSQELRQATYWGPFIELMNELSNVEFWSEFDIFSTNDIRRMLDIEYISELTIALLNGHQNKKAKLDQYYEVYEESFEHAGYVKNIFFKVLGELAQTLPNLSKTRWSKKTDFYTLFLFYSSHENSLPLTSEKRQIANGLLMQFAEELDSYVKSVDKQNVEYSPLVIEYALGSRASTDLGSRKRRFECLEQLFSGVF